MAANLFVTAKVHPRFLHSNSTSHTWPFSAVAELIDNAYDSDVAAKELWIDMKVIKCECCLTFTDNGKGMDLDQLTRMLSFGFSNKQEQAANANGAEARCKPIGLYGNGFKSGTMRLATDALVLTVCKMANTACIGLLSQTLCNKRKLDTVVLPMLEYKLPTFERNDAIEHTAESLEAIINVSPYADEEALKLELQALYEHKNNQGTKIVLFGLERNKDGMFELDFESHPSDIRNPETQEKVDQSIQQKTKVFEYQQSLRAYCSILYLKPRMQIFIRGIKVQNYLIQGILKNRINYTYTPKGKISSMLKSEPEVTVTLNSLAYCARKIKHSPEKQEKGSKITFGKIPTGAAAKPEDYGIMFYHNNRLIKPYVKVGCQNTTGNGRAGIDVVGVIDVSDILQPIHNKQDFLTNSIEYRSTISALTRKLEQYLKIGLSTDAEESYQNSEWNWVQCDKCSKWRRLPHFDKPEKSKNWYCHMNSDMSRNRCEFQEEELGEEEYDIPNSQASGIKPRRRGRGRGSRNSSQFSGTSDSSPTVEIMESASRMNHESTIASPRCSLFASCSEFQEEEHCEEVHEMKYRPETQASGENETGQSGGRGSSNRSLSSGISDSSPTDDVEIMESASRMNSESTTASPRCSLFASHCEFQEEEHCEEVHEIPETQASGKNETDRSGGRSSRSLSSGISDSSPTDDVEIMESASRMNPESITASHCEFQEEEHCEEVNEIPETQASGKNETDRSGGRSSRSLSSGISDSSPTDDVEIMESASTMNPESTTTSPRCSLFTSSVDSHRESQEEELGEEEYDISETQASGKKPRGQGRGRGSINRSQSSGKTVSSPTADDNNTVLCDLRTDDDDAECSMKDTSSQGEIAFRTPTSSINRRKRKYTENSDSGTRKIETTADAEVEARQISQQIVAEVFSSETSEITDSLGFSPSSLPVTTNSENYNNAEQSRLARFMQNINTLLNFWQENHMPFAVLEGSLQELMASHGLKYE